MSQTELTVEPAKAPATEAPIAGAKPKTELLKMGERGVSLTSMEDAFRFGKAIVASGMAPKGYTTAEQVIVAIQMGAEVGLPPMSALQNIAVINGRATIYGDAVPGIVNASGLMEQYTQEQVGEIGKDSEGWKVTVKRKGRSEAITALFTVEKAKKAGLWGKAGPWTQYPDRMLLMRARTFALRDAFNDVLKGMAVFEEVRDTPQAEKNVTKSLEDLA